MSKMKTNRGAAKRFKKTANGYKRKQSHKRHLLSSKTRKRKRQLRGCLAVAKQDVGQVKHLLKDA